MAEKKIRVLGCRLYEDPKVVELPDTLEALQEFVGGYIETVSLPHGIILILDEEGKLKRKDMNFALGRDYIVGDVLFVGSGEEDFISITEEQVAYIMRNILN